MSFASTHTGILWEKLHLRDVRETAIPFGCFFFFDQNRLHPLVYLCRGDTIWVDIVIQPNHEQELEKGCHQLSWLHFEWESVSLFVGTTITTKKKSMMCVWRLTPFFSQSFTLHLLLYSYFSLSSQIIYSWKLRKRLFVMIIKDCIRILILLLQV